MKTPNYFKVILVVFIVSLLLYALFLVFNNQQKVEKFLEASTGAGPSVPEPNSSKVVLYYANWCGHCQEYKKSGVFEKVAQECKQDPALGNKVIFEQKDGDNHESDMNKYNIRGFPSIIAIDSNGNKIDDFNGDRYDEAQLKEFAKKAATA